MVAGVGGGKFAPEDQVTGFQAAKMLLVALGYEAERENFNTPMWETNVSVRAVQAGLFQGLDDLNPSAPLSRDSAAQMIWNALNAGEVEYVTQTVTDDNGQTATKVVLQDKVTGNTQEKLTLIKSRTSSAWTHPLRNREGLAYYMTSDIAMGGDPIVTEQRRPGNLPPGRRCQKRDANEPGKQRRETV